MSDQNRGTSPLSYACHAQRDFQGQRFLLRRTVPWLSILAAVLIPGVVPAGTADEIRTVQCDVLIAGATESGWAAAIQAAQLGVPSITIVHDSTWVGGQFTEQALACVDENKGVGKVGWGVDWHPMKRSFHRSGLFRRLMDEIESFNELKYGDPMPGRPFHGPSTFRPAEAEAIFRQLLQPCIDSGQVQLITGHYPLTAEVDRSGERPRLTAVQFAAVNGADIGTTPVLRVVAPVTIDATDWGEVIQVSGAPCEYGPDLQSRYQEPSAPRTLDDSPPNEMNPITWAMIVEDAGEESPIPLPDRFDDRCFPRATHLSRTAFGRLNWDRPVSTGGILHWPDSGRESGRQLSVLTVRRIVDGSTAKTGQTVALMNYMLGQDYPLERLPAHVAIALEQTEVGASEKNIVQMTRAQRQIIYDDAKRHSLCVLYHMQNFVHQHAPDTTNSLRHFRLSSEFGTPDHLPQKPYIREALRLQAMYMMREQDGRNADGLTKDAARERFARVLYPDGIFCWQFHYDFHNTGRAWLKDEGDTGPWVDYEKPGRHTHHVSDRSLFPLRSLVPVEMDGLLGAQKNLGYSSIVCAAIRLHDQGIATGQAAGAIAAVCRQRHVQPREIADDRALLEQVRHALCGSDGLSDHLLLFPFRDLSPDDPSFVAVNRMAVAGCLPVNVRDVDFRATEAADESWMQSVIQTTAAQFEDTDVAEQILSSAVRSMTSGRDTPASRGEFCQVCWSAVQHLPFRKWVRLSEKDADLDGIPDVDDPTPFIPGEPVIWEIEQPGPETDGLPAVSREQEGNAEVRRFNFCGPPTKQVEGYAADHGSVFSDDIGFGWDHSVTENWRERGVYPEAIRDTFLFTRDHAIWECRVPDGRWHVSLCVGDSGHEQTGQRVSVEGQEVVVDQSTAAGHFFEVDVAVDVRDGRLTVELGPQTPGHNTCINWLHIRPAVLQ
ncbi:MAG: FAD-dependent oxidoreductase [Planctomycetaceae bacterium]|nr:FAD-dependent oxidoreductase [Planctomycetaceae bacterium]